MFSEIKTFLFLTLGLAKFVYPMSVMTSLFGISLSVASSMIFVLRNKDILVPDSWSGEFCYPMSIMTPLFGISLSVAPNMVSVLRNKDILVPDSWSGVERETMLLPVKHRH